MKKLKWLCGIFCLGNCTIPWIWIRFIFWLGSPDSDVILVKQTEEKSNFFFQVIILNCRWILRNIIDNQFLNRNYQNHGENLSWFSFLYYLIWLSYSWELKVDGKSEIVKSMWREISFPICQRHLFISRAVTKLMFFFLKKELFFFTRAQCVTKW